MTILQLSPGYWFNVDDILFVKDAADQYTKDRVLVVYLKHTQTPIKLTGDARTTLLTFLAQNALIFP